MVATGMLTLVFGDRECSDFWGDAMKTWWSSVRPRCRGIRRLLISLDNGPKNSGVTRKFLRRMVDFADWSGLEIRLVYYPPYHSKYNPIERCWSSLQQKWNGVLGERQMRAYQGNGIYENEEIVETGGFRIQETQDEEPLSWKTSWPNCCDLLPVD
jgi:hypothetical protein